MSSLFVAEKTAVAFAQPRSYYFMPDTWIKKQIPWRKKKMKKQVFNSVDSSDGSSDLTLLLTNIMVANENGRAAS